MYKCIPFSDQLIFVLTPTLLTIKDEKYVSNMRFLLCVFIIVIPAAPPSYQHQ